MKRQMNQGNKVFEQSKGNSLFVSSMASIIVCEDATDTPNRGESSVGEVSSLCPFKTNDPTPDGDSIASADLDRALRAAIVVRTSAWVVVACFRLKVNRGGDKGWRFRNFDAGNASPWSVVEIG